MEKLSLAFGFIAILFLFYGLYLSFNISNITETLILSCFIVGFTSSMLFLITDKLSE